MRVTCGVKERAESKSTPKLRAAGFTLGDRLPSSMVSDWAVSGGPKIIISDFVFTKLTLNVGEAL